LKKLEREDFNVNDGLINEEYQESITYLKKFFLGDKFILSNKQFYKVLKAIFQSKYKDVKIDSFKISEEHNVDKKLVEELIHVLEQKDKLSYLDFPFFGNLINISKYSEEERLDFLDKIISSQEENARVLSEFMPEDLLSGEGVRALEEYMFQKIFKYKLQPMLNELENEFNPSFTAKYEYVCLNEEYQEKYKNDKDFECLLSFNYYLVKEDEYFVKLYDPDTLESIFDNTVKLNKNILIRKACNFLEGDRVYE
jgi:hypothetical protein